MTHLRLGDALVQEKFITAAQRDAALVIQGGDRRRLLGEILVAQGALDAAVVRHVLVQQLGVPSVDLARFPREADCGALLAPDLARRAMAVALYRTEYRVALAMENPTAWDLLRDLERAIGLKVDAAMATREDILALLEVPAAVADAAVPSGEAASPPSEERLRVLSARVLSIQEEERRHLSRDLHDDVCQALTALTFGLHRLAPHVAAEGAAILESCKSMADATLERVRQLAHDIRPPQLDELGMEEAIRWLVERQRAATGIDIKCHFNGLLGRRFAGGIEIACYRITQEALSNATKHARAQSILVALEGGANLLRLTVRDDGRGFDAAAKVSRACGLGLIGMDERANLAGGRLTVGSEAEQGTIVRAVFPLDSSGVET